MEKTARDMFLKVIYFPIEAATSSVILHRAQILTVACPELISIVMSFSPKSSCPSEEYGIFLLYTGPTKEICASIKGLALIMQDTITSLSKHVNMSFI
jgi:hypothetical protein